MRSRHTPRSNQGDMLIIGVGNPDRGDDGVGLAVADALSDAYLDRVSIRHISGNCLVLLDLWSQAERVIIIDAVHSGGKPGAIYRLDAHQQTLSQPMFGNSTHAFGVANAVELARSLRQLPPHLIIYGIEGHQFETGAPLSAEVAQALPEVVLRIRDEMRRWPQPDCAVGSPERNGGR
jgi:hydrogenase maturation protease